MAVLLIINSHADICYPKFKMLATGGAIGISNIWVQTFKDGDYDWKSVMKVF